MYRLGRRRWRNAELALKWVDIDWLSATLRVESTIVVTSTIAHCKDPGEELKDFLVEHTESPRQSRRTGAHRLQQPPDLSRLPYLDTPASKVEWIVAVSMLNEGWDVKRGLPDRSP